MGGVDGDQEEDSEITRFNRLYNNGSYHGEGRARNSPVFLCTFLPVIINQQRYISVNSNRWRQ